MLDIKEVLENSEITTANEYVDIESKDIVFARDETKVIDLEKFSSRKRRFNGNYTTSSIASLADFAKENVNPEHTPTCFIEDDGKATLILNFGTNDDPLHQDLRAMIELKKTPVFKSLIEITDTRLKQRELAEFIEDFNTYITALDAQGNEINLNTAISAIRDITIESSRKAQQTQEEYRDTSSAFASVEAKFKNATPVFLKFNIPVYNEIENKEFIFRISVITSDDRVALSIRCATWDQVIEQINLEFREKVAEQLTPLGVKTFIGNWK